MLGAPKIELRTTLHKRGRKIIAVHLRVRYRNTRTNPTLSERVTCKLLHDRSRPKGLDVAFEADWPRNRKKRLRAAGEEHTDCRGQLIESKVRSKPSSVPKRKNSGQWRA